MRRKKDPILDIEARKEILRLQIRQQEMEIRDAAGEVVEFFTLPNLTNNVLGFVLRDPEPALRLGVTIVEWITGMLGGRKRTGRTRRKTAKKK